MAFGFAEQVARDDCDVMYSFQAQRKGKFLSLDRSRFLLCAELL